MTSYFQDGHDVLPLRLCDVIASAGCPLAAERVWSHRFAVCATVPYT